MSDETKDDDAKPGVRKRKLGATSLEVTELALGTWGISGEGYGAVTGADADATIERAVEIGINLFETSDAYDKGGMETRLGRVLEPFTDRTYVVTRHGIDRTKSPARRDYSATYLATTMDAARKRLRRDVLDVLVLHNPSVESMISGQTKPFLEDQKAKGKLRAWGVSASDLEVAREAIALGCDVLEYPYNLFHSVDLHVLVGEIAEKPTGVLAHSVLSYGLLGGAWHESKIFAEGDHRRDRWTRPELSTRIKQLEAARSLLSDDVHTTRSAALRFVLENRLVSSAVLGPRNVAQLEQLVRDAGKGPPYLDVQKLSRLPSRLVAVGIDP